MPYIDDEQKKVSISDVSKETFLTALGDGPLLKVMLDTVIENKTTTDLSICEVGAVEGQAHSHVSPLVSLHPLVHLKYTAADKEGLLAEIRESAEEKQIEVSSWDVAKKPPAGMSKFDLVIASNLIHQTSDVASALTNIKSVLKTQGFLLLHEVTASLDLAKAIFGQNGFGTGDQEEKFFLTEEQWCEVLKKEGLCLVSLKRTGSASTLMLFRLAKDGIETEPIIVDIDESFEWVPELQRHMSSGASAPIWIRASTPSPSGIVGMTNCLRHEMGGERIRCLFNASGSKKDIMSKFEKLRGLDLAMNVYKDGKMGSYRHVLMENNPSASEETEHAYVNVLTRGDLSSLRWIASHLKYAPGKQGTSELCNVYYTSLNFRDIMLATGKLPPDALPGDLANQDCILGMEFSGKNQKGQRIMGLLPAQALATTVMADQRFTWEVSCLVSWKKKLGGYQAAYQNHASLHCTLYCTALHCTPLQDTTLYCTVLYYAPLYSSTTGLYTALHNIELHSLHYSSLHYTAMQCNAQHRTAPHSTAPHSTAPHHTKRASLTTLHCTVSYHSLSVLQVFPFSPYRCHKSGV